MARGGYRPGSGRPKGSGNFGVATYPLRVPIEFLCAWKDGMSRYWRELLAYYEGELRGKDNEPKRSDNEPNA